MSATYLLPICFHKLSDVARTDFSALFLCLCDDGTPLVRRAAAINFSKMIKAASPAQMQPGYTLAFENFSKHEQESIRIQSIGICVTLRETMPLEFKMSRVLPVVLSLCKDKAWRVRYTLVNRLHEVLARLPSAELPLAAAYDALLQDLEAEVRAAAAASMAVTCKHLSRDTVHNKLLSSIQRLTIDNSDTVRVAVAAGLGGMVSVLGKDETVECVLPMLLALLRDEASDVSVLKMPSLSCTYV
jgi:serine/threonine-protein phosphatase 2A regulatory subunit A